jgi:hypothetical protein
VVRLLALTGDECRLDRHLAGERLVHGAQLCDAQKRLAVGIGQIAFDGKIALHAVHGPTGKPPLPNATSQSVRPEAAVQVAVVLLG